MDVGEHVAPVLGTVGAPLTSVAPVRRATLGRAGPLAEDPPPVLIGPVALGTLMLSQVDQEVDLPGHPVSVPKGLGTHGLTRLRFESAKERAL